MTPSQYWITLVLLLVAAWCPPIVAECARRTDMITHMISGCFGLVSVYFLLEDDREDGSVWLNLFVALHLVSPILPWHAAKCGVLRRLRCGLTDIGASVDYLKRSLDRSEKYAFTDFRW